jgi:Ni/Co efflux regulator RcnB
MKTPKFITLLAIAAMLMVGTVSVQATNSGNDQKDKKEYNKENDKKDNDKYDKKDYDNKYDKGNKYDHKPNNAKAPLDGGLLSVILGVSGAIYFIKRRKKNQQ